MKVVVKLIKRLVDSPYVNLGVGLLLLVGGLTETWDTLREDLFAGNLRGHHGVAVFGLFKALQAIPEFFEGMERVSTTDGQKPAPA